MLNKSIIKTDLLKLLDRNNQELKNKDFIIINTLFIIKHNKGRL
jgi:hypothetical protein